MTFRLMADSLYPNSIPLGVADVVATEIDNPDNRYSWSQLAARFPDNPRVAIRVFETAPQLVAPEVIRALDVEHGALTPAQAAQTAATWPDVPWPIYIGKDRVDEQKAALTAVGYAFAAPASWPLGGPYLWDADWTRLEHVNPGSLLTQYDSLAGYDISAVSADAPTFPSLSLPQGDDVPAFLYVYASSASADGTIKIDSQWLLGDYRHPLVDLLPPVYGTPVAFSGNQIAAGWPPVPATS